MRLFQVLLMALFSLLGFAANAAGPDLTALTTGVDFSTLVTAIMAVAVLAVGWVMAKGGAVTIVRFISRMIGG